MEKVTIMAIVLAVLLIAGAVFASAKFLEEDEAENSETEIDLPQQECNSGTCNQQCGGNCGIPRCGCGR